MKYHHTYSLMDVMMADPIKPMPDHKREHQINKMKDGLLALERAANPSIDDWEIVTDALNMMETLIEMGWAQDPDGLIEDAVKALAIAGQRSITKNVPIRLDGVGIKAVRGLLEDYETALKEMPERTMMHCHRKTEKRVQDILAGRCETHDVQVTK